MLKSELQKVVKGEVLDDEDALTKYSRDASLFKIKPQIAVWPKDSEDIQSLVRFVNDNTEKNLSLTARSAGTDMTGGPLNESIILDFLPHISRIKEVGDGYAITQPGVFYRDFEKETLKRGFLLPSYPASREICSVGGMVANNSGGEKTLTYGDTGDYVEELKVVLSDGNEYLFQALNRAELEGKMKQENFEGEIYRRAYRLLEENYDLIKNAKPKVSKNSAGYLLWDIWDRNTFDLTKLFAGSQGTLGVITEIKFRLIKPKPYSRMLVVFLKDLKPLAEVVNRVLKYKPESFESYDDKTLKLVFRFLPDMLKLMGAKNLISLGWKFLPELEMLLTGGLPKLVLLAEFTGDDSDEVVRQVGQARKNLADMSLASRITKDAAEANKYWIIRRESFNLLRKVKGKRTAPFIDDVIVRPERLPEFLPKLEEILNRYKLNYTVAGHIGDGNFHIIPLVKLHDPNLRQIIPELSKKVYELVLGFDGSITGEHNDGLIRGTYLKQMYGSEIYSLFEEVKKIFDPNNIFNPGKKVGVNFEYALNHIEA